MAHWYYISPQEYAEAATHGIKPRTLEQRIRELGWDKQRALTTPPRKRSDYSRWWPVMKKHGIPRQVFYNRISNGWDPEKAATEPLMTSEKRANLMRENNPKACSFPQELIDQAAQNGVSRKTFAKRVSLGWSWERAATEPLVSKQECGRRGIRAIKQQRGDINALIFQKRG